MCLPTIEKIIHPNGTIWYVVTKCGGEQITLSDLAVTDAIVSVPKKLSDVLTWHKRGKL